MLQSGRLDDQRRRQVALQRTWVRCVSSESSLGDLLSVGLVEVDGLLHLDVSDALSSSKLLIDNNFLVVGCMLLLFSDRSLLIAVRLAAFSSGRNFS